MAVAQVVVNKGTKKEYLNMRLLRVARLGRFIPRYQA